MEILRKVMFIAS